MSMTLLHKDMTYISAFLNETAFSLSFLAVENAAEPKNFISFNVPNFSLGSADLSPMSTAGGSRTTTIAVPAALVGHDNTGVADDDSMFSVQISNLT